jgi:hypothetical protein
MKGELANAEFWGGIPDLRNRPKGDNKIDLEVLLTIGWTITDAKGSPMPRSLIVGRDALPDAIYVLCGPVNHLYVNTGHLNTVPGIGYLYDCLGWQWGHEMLQQSLEQMPHSEPKHTKLAWQLRPMDELKAMYLGQWRHHGREPQPAKHLELVVGRQVGAWPW